MTIRARHRLRRRALENSAATALVAASIPPIPRPVSTRQTDKVVTFCAVVAINMPTVITTKQASIVGRLPMRSARFPSRIEPMAMPMSSIDRTKPSAARSMPQSLAMPGEAKLIARTSKPSSPFSPTVVATAAICNRDMGSGPRMSTPSAF